MKFADDVNPTEAELRAWAAEPDALAPEQDWNLIVAEWAHIELITELAASTTCPNRGFFLAVLYLMAGDCVRDRSRTNMPRLRDLLERLEKTPSPSLQLFRARAVSLLAEPSSFDYSKWCDGGYARERDGT